MRVVKNKSKKWLKNVESDTTREKLIRSAEKLFAERGIDSVSLADIHKAAGQKNRSAANHYFGNKDGLIAAILEKHNAVNEKRLFTALDTAAASGHTSLKETIQVIVDSVAENLNDPDGGVAYIQLIAQLIGHPKFLIMQQHLNYINSGTDTVTRISKLVLNSSGGRKSWFSRWILWSGMLFHALADYSRLAEGKIEVGDLPSQEEFTTDLSNVILSVMRTAILKSNGNKSKDTANKPQIISKPARKNNKS
jgi:AcrR family transcriptional regulator